MVNPSVIGITAILIFMVLLILIFALTGHLFANPYGILLILLITIMLISGFLLLAYLNTWWPYSAIDKSRNNIILGISVGVLIISTILFIIFLYQAVKHNRSRYVHYVHHQVVHVHEEPIREPEPFPRQEPERVPEGEPEVPIRQVPIRQVPMRQELTNQQRQLMERSEVERLALENELQEQATGLEPGSGLKLAARDQILSEELEQKNIRQDIAEEGVEMAQLKQLEATRALRSLYPSREMFGPGGAEDVITGAVRSNIPIEPSTQQELQRITSGRELTTREQRREPRREPIDKQRINERNEQMRNERGSEYNPLLRPRVAEPESAEFEREPEVRREEERVPSEEAEIPESFEKEPPGETGVGEESETGLADLEGGGDEGGGLFSELESGLEEGGEGLEEGSEMGAEAA